MRHWRHGFNREALLSVPATFPFGRPSGAVELLASLAAFKPSPFDDIDAVVATPLFVGLKEIEGRGEKRRNRCLHSRMELIKPRQTLDRMSVGEFKLAVGATVVRVLPASYPYTM